MSHAPRYIPKYEREQSPPPAKPRRTDRPEYDTTTAFRKQDSGGGEYNTNDGGGLEELDNLLAMLSDTQAKQLSK